MGAIPMEVDPSAQNKSAQQKGNADGAPGTDDTATRENVLQHIPRAVSHKILHVLRSGQTLLVWTLLLLFAFLRNKDVKLETDNKSIFGEAKEGAIVRTITLNCGTACLYAAVLTVLRVIIDYMISYSMLYLVRSRITAQELFSTIHSLSSHISGLIVLIFLFVCIVFFEYNAIVKIEAITSLSFSQVVMVCLTATLLFGTLHLFSERIRHSFNDTTSLNRMLDCLYAELVLKVIDLGNVREEATRYYIKRRLEAIVPRKGTAGGDALSLTGRDVHNTLKKLILYEFYRDEYFRGQYATKDLKEPEVLKKKIHKTLMKNTSFIFDGEIAYMTRVSYLFPDSAIFEAIQAHVGIEPNATLPCSELIALIVKTLGERTDINENLHQRYSALSSTEIIIKIVILSFCVASFFFGLKIEKESVFEFASPFAGLAYMLQPPVTDLVNGLIFLFFIHPFDIGDRVLVKVDDVKENMVVLETHILYTVFQRWDNVKVYVYNKNLYKELIHNLRRCESVIDPQNIEISLDTDEAKIQKFKAAMDNFLQENSCDYSSSCMLNYVIIENTNKLRMAISVFINESGQDYERYHQLKTRLLEAVIERLQGIGVRYAYPVQKVEILKTVEA